MIDGEWMMITADTTVMAANGNVYAAVLSPEGIPIGVMHVPAMQEVMLGELGGTVTVTQAEDMSWWIGEMAVDDRPSLHGRERQRLRADTGRRGPSIGRPCTSR